MKRLLFLFLLPALNDVNGQIKELGFLPDDSYSEALEISGDGLVVVGRSQARKGPSNKMRGTNQMAAFRWEDGKMTSLNKLGDRNTSSSAEHVNRDGSIIVGHEEAFIDQEKIARAFIWTKSSNEITALTSRYSGAAGVSDDGSVVVGCIQSKGSKFTQSFRWAKTKQSSRLKLLRSKLYSRQHSAAAVSGDGSATVVNGSQNTVSGAWPRADLEQTIGVGAYYVKQIGSRTNVIDLGSLDGAKPFVRATDLSSDGSFVVGCASGRNSGTEAFSWSVTTRKMKSLQFLDPFPTEGHNDTEHAFSQEASRQAKGSVKVKANSPYTIAHGVSLDGKTIVGVTGVWSTREKIAVVWHKGQIHELAKLLESQGCDLAHWKSLDIATGVSDDGKTVVGQGTTTEDRLEAFIAKLK